MNDSSTGGYLAPLDDQPAEELDLEGLVQPVIVGITGLADGCVVVKGQPVPPQQPGRVFTWCAFGVTTTEADANPSVVHDGAGDGGLGVTTLFRGEELEVSVSFYGPACRSMAARLRDGFGLGQNREALRGAGLAFVRVERITVVPELTNTQFIRRADAVLRLRRILARSYAVRNVLRLTGQQVVDAGSTKGQTTVVNPLTTGI